MTVTRYPIKTILICGDGFEVSRLLAEDSQLSIEFTGESNKLLMAIFERWQQEESVSFKLALKSGGSGEILDIMRKFEALSKEQQWDHLITRKT